MFHKLILLLVCVLSFNTAFADRVDECSKPGTKISSEFLGLVGQESKIEFTRKGNLGEISNEISGSKEISAVVSKSYKNIYCELQTYSIEETKCSPLDIDIALGRGNVNFKAFYNLSLPLLKRAQLFIQNVNYSDANSDETAKLETAKTVVTYLVTKASASTIPNNWDDLVLLLNELVTNGKVNKISIDSMTITFAEQNKAQLGFKPVDNANIKEGTGNELFYSIFDLTTSEYDRVQIIKNNFRGLTATAPELLASDFIQFASINGIPSKWNEVNLMLKNSVENKVLSLDEFKMISGKYESLNRNSLGFKIEATQCLPVKRNATYNAQVVKNENEFSSKETKLINVSVTNAPLLFGENETFVIKYDGLNPIQLLTESISNKYTVSTEMNVGVINYKLTGNRQKVVPQNTSIGQILKEGNILNFMYQNTNYNPKINGDVTVIVDFFESRFWGDKALGSRTITPKDGNLIKYLTQISMLNADKKPYAIVKIKYENSDFYNNTFSNTIRIDL